MDWDQQLNFYYCNAVAIIDRFISQPKFAGKTYMKLEGLELKQRIRLESKFPISWSPAHRHAQSLIAAFTLCQQIVLRGVRAQACIELRIPCTMRIATVCNILHKQQKLYILLILHIGYIVHIYMDIHT